MHLLGNASTNSAGATTPATLSRTDRLMARVVEQLATLAPAERPVWLRRQIAVWERQYERWALEVDSGKEMPPSDVTADDYLATISALGRLLHRIEP